MLCDQALGRSAEAIEVYERCRASLWAGLKLSPSKETADLYEQIAELGERP